MIKDVWSTVSLCNHFDRYTNSLRKWNPIVHYDYPTKQCEKHGVRQTRRGHGAQYRKSSDSKATKDGRQGVDQYNQSFFPERKRGDGGKNGEYWVEEWKLVRVYNQSPEAWDTHFKNIGKSFPLEQAGKTRWRGPEWRTMHREGRVNRRRKNDPF